MSLVLRPRVGELLLNTVLLVVVSVPLCLALGVGGAWLVERTTLWGHRGWAVALAAPLAIPAFVNSYGWVSAVSSLAGLWSGVLISVLSYFPLVFIPGPPPSAGSTRFSRKSAAALGDGPVAGSSGWSCRSCGSPSPAGRCWSACTCSPSTVPSR